LKKYCHQQGIRLLGDVPFYVSHDSVDVWTNPQLFTLDDDGLIAEAGGVPPDYFSKTGQHWGVPTYNWAANKAQGYDWWLSRLQKNIELFDVVRLDHFRAFADYWEIKPNQKDAIKGEWKDGPALEFFDALKERLKGCKKEALNTLPLIGEDLGDISPAVHSLRDSLEIPGMKVLHFGFGDNGKSDHCPHYLSQNSIVYTATHDNNTTRGWFEQLSQQEKEYLDLYVGHHLTEDNVHLALIRLALASVAKLAVVPAQDLLGLDENCRMNTPASTTNNWKWRLTPNQLTPNIILWLRSLTKTFARC
jgi:4-alpha-glucanotransferase